MFKKTIAMCLTVMMVLLMIPINNAYASVGVTNMICPKMNDGYQYKDILYDFNNTNTPIPQKTKGPLYDDIYFTNVATWTRKSDGTYNYISPGERGTGSFAFCLNLEESKMLGAAIKGQLSAESTVTFRNYDYDGDIGKAFITPYSSNGSWLNDNFSAALDSNNNWNSMTATANIRKDAKYVLFGGYGERFGGVVNKVLNFDVRSLYAKITDKTAPYVISIASQNEYIRQNADKNEPLLYVTMSENCTFGTGNTVSLVRAIDGFYPESIERSANLIYVGENNIDYTNGNVTYQFRIVLSQVKGHHWDKVKLSNLNATDTFGNQISQSMTEVAQINKIIDLRAPYTSHPSTIATRFGDEYGLSNVSYNLTHGGISNTFSVWNLDDLENQKFLTAKKEQLFEISEPEKTGLYNLYAESLDLAKNKTAFYRYDMFFISNNDPVKLSLQNSGAKFDILPTNVVDGAELNALTTMTLKTDESIVPANRLNGAKIYYKWANSNSSIPTGDVKTWQSVLFKPSSNETEKLKIPVSYYSDGFTEYLKPQFEKGYLYVIPSIGDDISLYPVFRAGSFVSKSNDTSDIEKDEGTLLNLIKSSPVDGEFINRGCECTNQNSNETVESHYGAISNHTKDIGFNVTVNQANFDKIEYFISPDGSNTVLESPYSITKINNYQYDIPITAIKNTTGNYTVTVSLYSKSGDVTVKKINVKIESPIIGISNILYNQSTQNLDFTVTYNKNSAELKDVLLELSNKNIVEFQENILAENGSIYAVSEMSVLNKDLWDSNFGDKTFIRTEFETTSDPRLLKADFRASLTNMERAGDLFVAHSGEKRIHIKYVTKNNVEVFNNNIAVIKKSNIPPSVTLSNGKVNTYKTVTQYNSDGIYVHIEEPIVSLEKVKYGWIESLNTSLITTGGAISGTDVDITSNEIDFSASMNKDLVTGNDLLKTYYLAIYAENSNGKYVQKFFGPFNVLNEDINDKRFCITATDKVYNNKSLFIAIDDKLYDIEELTKADKMKVSWKEQSNADNTVVKEYDINFINGNGENTNVEALNIPYPELIDTNGVCGNYELEKIEIYNSSNNTIIFKSIVPFNIVQTLLQYSVEINKITVETGAKVVLNQNNIDISYRWTENINDLPENWSTANIGTTSTDIFSNEKESIFNHSIYLLVKAWDNIYRSEKINLSSPDTLEVINDAVVNIGETNNGYYGLENGIKSYVPIRITTKPEDLNKIATVEVYDMFNTVTSSTAIKLDKMFKLSDNEIAGLIPSLVTSSGAIKCTVNVNGADMGMITSYLKEDMTLDMNYLRNNRIITLNNIDVYSKYTLYQENGKSNVFDNTGKTEIYDNGDYLLVYNYDNNFFADKITVSDINYVAEDINTTFSPAKPTVGKVTSPLKAAITMPPGAVINDKYHVVDSVVQDANNNVSASATINTNGTYVFNVKFANDQSIDYILNIDFIDEVFTPTIAASTSSTAITYNPEGPSLTKDDVNANLNTMLTVLNNNNSNNYLFYKNGNYSFIAKDAFGKINEYVASVDWINKKCPEPTIAKYVWYDFNDDGIIDVDMGEKGIKIPEGYQTKQNIIVEITFPHDDLMSRPVKLSGSLNFKAEDILESNTSYAYKYIMAYKPEISEGLEPISIQNLTFTDTLGNVMNYSLIIDEINKTELLTQLNYSTTSYTNRDVIVSMLSNRAIKRFEKVDVIDVNGTISEIERDASPTYVFKSNGYKDFNYRQINVVDGEGEEGTLKANVTWIDKNVPKVTVEYSNIVTNKTVEINFTIVNGVDEAAKLRYGTTQIDLTTLGKDLVGSLIVNTNGKYNMEVSNKYGNTGTIIVPITNIDTISPEINITGKEDVYIKLGDVYYDKGATAYDNRDFDITRGISTVNNVNTSIATNNNFYNVTYTVTDSAGNTSTKTRRVHVLDIDSAVVIVENNIIDLTSLVTTNVKLSASGITHVEFVGIEGNYTAKFKKGESDSYDNAYFKRNGSFLSKTGTFTAEQGIYTLYVQDQERNTRIIKLNFMK